MAEFETQGTNACDIQYRHSARARNLSITIRPDYSVVVSVPRRASKKQTEEFVLSRRSWIQKHLTRFKTQQPQDQQFDLSSIDLKQKQDELFKRLKSFSERYELFYERAGFRCQRTKWGSCCKSRRSISLNINMVTLPEHLQDYLMLHELTHLHHANHSKAFWNELDKYCSGKAKLLSKELKKYPLVLTGIK